MGLWDYGLGPYEGLVYLFAYIIYYIYICITKDK